MAKRAIKWGPTRIVTLAVAFLFMGFGLVGMSVGPVLAMSGAGQIYLDSYVAFVSVLAGAFLLYLLIVSLYNRIILADVEALLASPLPGRVILLERVYGYIQFWWIAPLLGAPFVTVFGIVSHAGVWYYPLAAVTLLATGAMLTGVSVLLTLLLLLAARRRMSRDMLGIITSLVAVMIFIGPRLLINAQMASAPQGFLLIMQNASWNGLPLAWFGRALSFFAAGSPIGLLYVAMLILLFALSAMLSLYIGDRFLHERLALLESNKAVHRRRRSGRTAIAAGGIRGGGERGAAIGRASAQGATGDGITANGAEFVPQTGPQTVRARRVLSGPVAAMVKKDLRRLQRTPIELLGFTISLVYVFAFLAQPGAHSGGINPGGVFAILLVTMAGMGQMAISSFGSEGQQMWLLLQSPVRPGQLVFAKWLYSFIPTFLWWQILSGLASYVLHMPLSIWVLFAIGGLWMIGGATMAVLPFGIVHADYAQRRVGRRSLYTKRSGAWHMAALLPYAALQGACFAYAALRPMDSGESPPWLALFVQIPADTRLVIAVSVSILLAVIAIGVGWSIANEVWRGKILELYETGTLA